MNMDRVMTPGGIRPIQQTVAYNHYTNVADSETVKFRLCNYAESTALGENGTQRGQLQSV
jgi:hypothetical protein